MEEHKKDEPVSNLPTVNVVTNAEREKALLTIVAAFAADPVVRWIVPQADIYLNHGVRFFDIFVVKPLGHVGVGWFCAFCWG